MKKISLLLLFVYISISVFSQAKQPIIMVVPDDIFCNRHAYTQSFEIYGQKKIVPDYTKAFQNDENLRLVISKINQMILERGYDKVKYLEQELKSLNNTNAELSALSSKSSNAYIKESPTDLLKRKAQADIIIGVDFNIKHIGPKKYITFNLQGYDAYTSNPVASVSGDGEPVYGSTTTSGKLIEEAILKHMDNFLNQLQIHFDNIFEKGRECKFRIQIWDDLDIDLEEEYSIQGESLELTDIIDDWFLKNSVEGRYSNEDGSENFIVFSARIPLFNKKGRPIDARRFLKELRSKLKKEPFNLGGKLYQRGLGEAWLIIGAK